MDGGGVVCAWTKSIKAGSLDRGRPRLVTRFATGGHLESHGEDARTVAAPLFLVSSVSPLPGRAGRYARWVDGVLVTGHGRTGTGGPA